MYRGAVAVHLEPGTSIRSHPRASLRRAFRFEWARRRSVAPRREHRVVPLGDGRYRLITTVTVERIVTEGELLRLGVAAPPRLDVPWVEPPPIPVPERGASPFAQVMSYWRKCFPSFPSQMPGRVPRWLDEHGVDALLKAISEVKAESATDQTPPYLRFIRKLRQLSNAREGPKPQGI